MGVVPKGEGWVVRGRDCHPKVVCLGRVQWAWILGCVCHAILDISAKDGWSIPMALNSRDRRFSFLNPLSLGESAISPLFNDTPGGWHVSGSGTEQSLNFNESLAPI